MYAYKQRRDEDFVERRARGRVVAIVGDTTTLAVVQSPARELQLHLSERLAGVGASQTGLSPRTRIASVGLLAMACWLPFLMVGYLVFR